MSRKRKKSPKRLLHFYKVNMQDQVLSKVVTIHLDKVDQEFVHFDKMKDGTWRMTVSSTTIPDADELLGISIRPIEEKEKTYGD